MGIYTIIKRIIQNNEGYSINEGEEQLYTPENISSEHEKRLGNKYSIYTPKSIVRKMINLSFENTEIKDNASLDGIRIADIACGTGNFLIEAADYLIRKSIELGEIYFLPEWIEGYDIDGEALKIARLRLKLLLKKHGIPYKNIKFNLFQCDVLPIEMEKRFDIILGNPPYMGEKNNREIFEQIKNTEFGKKYYEGKMDYLYFFIEKGIDLLRKDGILTYITTNYWLKADYAKILRDKIKSETSFVYAYVIDESVFKDNLGQDNLIFALKKSRTKVEIAVEDEDGVFATDERHIYSGNKITFARPEMVDLFERMEKRASFLLGEKLNINQGIVSGYDEAFVFSSYKHEFGEYLKPFYKNKDVRSYRVNHENEFWILYLNKTDKVNDEVLAHMEKYRERLENRREAKNGRIKWYELQWGRNEDIFTQPKIVARQRGSKELFGYTDKPYYGSADIYYLTPAQEMNLFSKPVSLFYILGYLNSEVFYKWFFHRGKRKGKDLELYSTPLKEVPVIYPADEEKIKYIENLVKMQINCYNDTIQEKIESFFRGEI